MSMLSISIQLLAYIYPLLDHYIIYKYYIIIWHSIVNLTLNGPEVSLTVVGTIIFFWRSLTLIFQLTSYAHACYMDPGYVPKLNPPGPDLLPQFYISHCSICQQWKPVRSNHCDECRRCVYKMDHHCDLIRNCVGYRNQKQFILFLFYLSVNAVSSTSLIILSGIYHLFDEKVPIHERFEMSFNKFYCLFFLILDAVIVYISIDFLHEQYDVIKSNQLIEESYNCKIGFPHDFSFNFKQVFGKRPLTWLLPMKHDIQGNYCEVNYFQNESTANNLKGAFENYLFNEKEPSHQKYTPYKAK